MIKKLGIKTSSMLDSSSYWLTMLMHPRRKFKCRVKNKSVLSDLVRMNLNNEKRLVYISLVQVFVSSLNYSQPPISLPSCIVIEVVVIVPQPPTQTTKTKSSKSKSSKPTSSASQKALLQNLLNLKLWGV